MNKIILYTGMEARLKIAIFKVRVRRRVLILFFFMTAGVWGKPYEGFCQFPKLNLEQISNDRGLQSAVVFRTVEDEQGLVWCCTYDGLYVYDGYRALKIDIRVCDTCPAQSTSALDILIDKNKNLWLLTQLGAGKFNKRTGVLRIIVPISVCSNPANFIRDNDSIINITRFGAIPVLVNIFNEKYGFPHLISNDKRLPLDFPINGKLHALNFSSSLYRTNFDNQILQRIPGSFDFVPLKGNAVHARKENAEGNFFQVDPLHRRWILSDTLQSGNYNFDVFDKEGNSIRQKLFNGLKPFFAKDVITDRAGNGLMNSSAGFIYFPKETGNPIDLGEYYPQLRGDHISEIRCDSNNVLWISTRGQGIYIADLRRQPFGQISESKTEKHGLFRNFVLGFIPYRPTEFLVQHEFGYSLPHTLLNHSKLKTHIMIPSNLGIIESFRNAVESMPGEPSFMQDVRAVVNQLPESDRKNWPGKSFFKRKGTPLYWYSRQGLYVNGNPTPIIAGIDPIGSRYQGDTLWMYTEAQGLYGIYLPNGRVTHLEAKPKDLQHGLLHNRVHGVCFDQKGDVWAATSEGLSHYNKKTGLFTHFTTKNGLCHNTIYNITLDSSGHFWLGTANGLSRFNPASKNFTNYFVPDGLLNSEYNRNSAFTAPNGMVFMGGTKGIDYLVPDEITGLSKPLKPLISMVQLPGKTLDPAKTWNLSSNENNLSFAFTVTDLSRAATCKYLFLLEGSKSPQWQMLNGGHEIQFANLNPGKYILRAKAINQQGEISTDEAIFRFSIATPWYSSWWFIAGIFGISMAVAWWIIYYRQRQKIEALEHQNELIRLHAERTRAIVHERERITADLHDDVGATLSSLNIYGDLAHSIWEANPEKSKEMIGKIAGQSRDLMLRMSDIIWSMKTEGNGTNGLTPRIKNFAQELLWGKGIEVGINIDETTMSGVSNPMVRKNIILIIKEALNNAAKYSEAKKVNVLLEKRGEMLTLEIADNGKGFEPGLEIKGNGLENMAARCRQMGGEFGMQSKPGEGTTISCSIPLAIISYKSIK